MPARYNDDVTPFITVWSSRVSGEGKTPARRRFGLLSPRYVREQSRSLKSSHRRWKRLTTQTLRRTQYIFLASSLELPSNMRFSPISLTFLVTIALASPAPAAAPAPIAVSYAAPVPNAPMCARNVAETDIIANTIVFGVESAKCKILQCAKIVATASCILDTLPDLTLTLACVSGNAQKVRRHPGAEQW
jgi:hypothetical protein